MKEIKGIRKLHPHGPDWLERDGHGTSRVRVPQRVKSTIRSSTLILNTL